MLADCWDVAMWAIDDGKTAFREVIFFEPAVAGGHDGDELKLRTLFRYLRRDWYNGGNDNVSVSYSIKNLRSRRVVVFLVVVGEVERRNAAMACF